MVERERKEVVVVWEVVELEERDKEEGRKEE